MLELELFDAAGVGVFGFTTVVVFEVVEGFVIVVLVVDGGLVYPTINFLYGCYSSKRRLKLSLSSGAMLSIMEYAE